MKILGRAAAGVTLVCASLLTSTTIAQAENPEQSIPEWIYAGHYPNISDCNDVGDAFHDLFGFDWDCRAASGGWDLYLWG